MIDLPIGKGGPMPAFTVGDEPAPIHGKERLALHLCWGQESLFAIRRDWTPLLVRLRDLPFKELPLTGAAQHLVEEFSRYRRESRPDYTENIRPLTYLVYWLGAEMTFFERDVYDLAELDANLAAAPVCKFLRDHGLLVEDPDLHQDANQVWIETTLAALPDPLASEMATWVTVLRGQGRREAEPRGYDGIRRYLFTLQPALIAWTITGVTTLREITSADAEMALNGLVGSACRGLAIALRSLFQALKREQVIFRAPARDLPVGDLKGVPRSVPSDLLAGLLEEAKTPFGRLVIALAAIHALPGHEIAFLHREPRLLSRDPRSTSRPPAAHPLPGSPHPPPRRRLVDLPPPTMARLAQSSPAGQSEERGRPRPPGRQHQPPPQSRSPRADPGGPAPRPHLQRGVRKRRPPQADAAVRSHREDRPPLRHHRPSRTHRQTPQMTGSMTTARLPR